MTPLEVLKGARALISEPSRWTRYACARDRHGLAVFSCSEAAVCWCLDGAVRKIAYGNNWKYSDAGKQLGLVMSIRPILNKATNSQEFTDWQDAHTHAEVLSMLDQTIANLEGQPCSR